MTHGPLSLSAFCLFESNPYRRHSLAEEARFEPTADTDTDTDSNLPYIYKPTNHQHPYSGHVNDSSIRTYTVHAIVGRQTYSNGNSIVSRQTYGDGNGNGNGIASRQTYVNSNGVRTHISDRRLRTHYFAPINPLSHHGSVG